MKWLSKIFVTEHKWRTHSIEMSSGELINEPVMELRGIWVITFVSTGIISLFVGLVIVLMSWTWSLNTQSCNNFAHQAGYTAAKQVKLHWADWACFVEVEQGVWVKRGDIRYDLAQ